MEIKNKKNGNTRHGLSDTPIQKLWIQMKQRCLNPNDRSYRNYGARGIRVCDRWMKFENFFADMGHKPKGKSLDRIDNDGSYSPRNCRWASRSEQGNNTRTNVNLEINGRRLTQRQAAKKFGLSDGCISKRRKKGFTGLELVQPKLKPIILTVGNIALSIKQLAEKIDMKPDGVRKRLYLGWSMDRILSTPRRCTSKRA